LCTRCSISACIIASKLGSYRRARPPVGAKLARDGVIGFTPNKKGDYAHCAIAFFNNILLSEVVVFIEPTRFTLQLVHKTLNLTLNKAAHVVEADAGECRVDPFFEVQVTQFHRSSHGAKG